MTIPWIVVLAVPDSSFLSAILANLSDPRLIAAAAAGAIAGVVRGFSGFGAALVYVPLVSAVYDPPVAACTIFLISMFLGAPFTIAEFRRCDWGGVLPLAIAASCMVPVGALLLRALDSITMRWIMGGMVFCGLVMLIYGRRYASRPGLSATIGVGALAGVFGGAAQMSGPPVVVYWLGGMNEAAVVRANLMVFFALTGIASGVTYYLNGMITPRALAVAMVAGPAYFCSMFLGWRLFGLASDKTFRRIAIAIVALSALAALPVFDRLYR
jgi:uncharacterized membrane protein YfcA